MSIFGLPLILFSLVKKRGRKLSDLEFLSIKEFDGKLRTDKGQVSSIADIASLTANIGKDMYIAKAKVVFSNNGTTNGRAFNEKVVLSLNGVPIETAAYSVVADPSNLDGGGTSSMTYEFKNMGLKVAAGEIIKIRCTAISPPTEIEGFISCFEEDTDESPQIPAT